MVRRYRRRVRRSRTLRSSNVYRRTSAKSQARQIVALNRKISRVYKSLRPDTQVFYTNPVSRIFNNSAASAVHYFTSWTASGFKNSDGISFELDPGDSRKLYNFRVAGTVEYSDNYPEQAAVDHQRTCSIRIILGQSIRSASASVSENSILETVTSGDGYELNCVRPLRDNCTSYVKILYDKSYPMSDQNPIREIKWNFRKLLPWRRDAIDGAYHYGAFWILVTTAGLHWDSNYSQQLKFNYMLKLALPEH